MPTITTSADDWILNAAKDDNGSDWDPTTLYSGYEPDTGRTHFYLKFDVSGRPKGASWTLKFYIGNMWGGSSVTVIFYTCGAFTEGVVTWNTRPATDVNLGDRTITQAEHEGTWYEFSSVFLNQEIDKEIDGDGIIYIQVYGNEYSGYQDIQVPQREVDGGKYAAYLEYEMAGDSGEVKCGFTVRRTYEELPAGMQIRGGASRDLMCGFQVYNYITVLSREELLFDGKDDYDAYLYRARSFSTRFQIKGEFEAKHIEISGGLYFVGLSDMEDSLQAALNGGGKVAFGLIMNDAGTYKVMCGAYDGIGIPDIGSPVNVSLDTTYYYIFRKDFAGNMALEVYSDPEFTVLVGSSSPVNPHNEVYDYLFAVDGGGYTPVPPGNHRAKAYCRRLRVVLERGKRGLKAGFDIA